MVKRKGFPQPGEVIMCTVHKLTENAAWCKLDEYVELEGMIHVSESAGRWVYNIKDVVKIGKQYVAKVLHVDAKSAHIELSLKRVSRFDEKQKLNQFRKEQRAENILNQVAKSMGKKLDVAYKELGFALQEEFGELSTAFDDIKDNPGLLDKIDADKAWKDALTSTINKIFAGKKVSLKAELEIKCYGEDGIETIRQSLSEFEKRGFEVKYISAPKYTIETVTNDPKKREKEMVGDLDNFVKEAKGKNCEVSYKLVK